MSPPEPSYAPTPSQTVGPFYGYALPFPRGGDVAPDGDPETITLHGYVLDGEGRPVPDALIETWQPGPDGSRVGVPGSLRHDPVTGRSFGRDGVAFTGFGRVPTDADGHWAVRTLPPGGVSYISLAVFARGLLHHLYTRAYVVDEPGDALLGSLDAERRATLVARSEAPRTYRFDIRLQGDGETVFLEFPSGPGPGSA
ncbi:protocatechuate 3,4-dioxygenase subunit alpha [Streptomyces venezuelae]|uniref:Protocatechuate 3,4-dioxygenase subunit alpha n=1 Tax=Streptomyces venezuelae TaxID=54571 RepID=A0A5P2CVP0_STRVZ|nr:protocatechuate 3,4-dioxygenase subunit alpha [Streptomyces venezuelae]QES44929.1 protocatechuate 3,4-dioxygenase subunit alpha [Streptomyces venezuelae]